MIELITGSEEETRAVGRRLAKLLRAGDVVLLAGELGAGKTVLAAGIGEGLGVTDRVVSPSYVLARTYHAPLPLTHADVYRLGNLAELSDLDLFEQPGVLVVEWGQAVQGAMPSDHLLIELEVSDPDTRRLRLIPRGEWQSRGLDEVLA